MVANPYQSPEGDLTVNDDGFGEIRFFSPSSRIGRLRYMAHAGLVCLVFYALLVPGIFLFTLGEAGIVAGVALIGIAYVAMIVITWIFIIQRLHDLEKSGWLSLLLFIPLVNFALAIYVIFWPGTPGSNNFGKRPPPNKTWHWIVGSLMPVIALLGVIAAVALPAYQEYTERVNSSYTIEE